MSSRSLIGVCLTVVVLLAMSALAYAEDVLFYDDFSTNPKDRWTQVSSFEGEEWIWDEAAQVFTLQVPKDADYLQIIGDDNWTDYSIEIKVKTASGDRFGILFRANKTEAELGGTFGTAGIDGIVLYADKTNLSVDTFSTWRRFGDSIPKPISKDETGRPILGFKADRWYVVRLDVVGQTVTVFVDGEELGTREFEGYEKGFIGLYTFIDGAYASWDYVKVTAL